MTSAPGGALPPHDTDAEQAVLGAMLLSADAVADVCETVTVADFYDTRHGSIFAAVTSLYAAGAPADAVTVAAAWARTGYLDRVGGAGYLHTLAAGVPTVANVTWYAGIVVQKAKLRRLHTAAVRIAHTAMSGHGDADDLIDIAQEDIYAVSAAREAGDYRSLGAVLADTLTGIEAMASRGDDLSGVPTGLADLDRLTGGLQPGQMVVVAGRPAMGKSAFALDVLRAAAIGHGMPAALFSLEMSTDEISQRLLAAEASVSLGHIRSGKLSEKEWERLGSRLPELSAKPLFIDDSANLTMLEVRAKCRRLAQREGLKLVVLDYLQLLTSARRVDSRQVEVAEFSRAAKLLAKELHLPVVVLSQLNRASEMRADKRPMLSDLRESGAIEQDADVVVLLHRDDVYDPDSPRAGEADVIVAKHRNGPTATIPAAFQGHYSRFANLAGNTFS